MRTIVTTLLLLTTLLAAPAASAWSEWDEPMEVPFKAGDGVTTLRISPAVMAQALTAMGFSTFGEVASTDAATLEKKYDPSKGLGGDGSLKLNNAVRAKFWAATIEAAKAMDAGQAITPAAAKQLLQLQGKMQHESRS